MGRGWVDEVVDDEDGVRGLGHEILTEVGGDEPVGPDHADGGQRYEHAIKIQPAAVCRRRRRWRQGPTVT